MSLFTAILRPAKAQPERSLSTTTLTETRLIIFPPPSCVTVLSCCGVGSKLGKAAFIGIGLPYE